MPFSLDPQPAEDEIECANCGALIYYELTRCPKCGVNLYEPDDRPEAEYRVRSEPSSSTLEKLRALLRRLAGKPSPAEELFGAFLKQQSELYNDLLLKVGGDPAVVERLVEFERQQSPGANRTEYLQNAIRRWEYDNLKL
jgi:predicted  nucleic acid-binding Zn-ribbon protein